jgi:nitrous oxidase accessory protein
MRATDRGARRRGRVRVLRALLVFVALSAASAQAQSPREIAVGGVAGVATVREAIARAAAGDRIVIAAGTYREGTIVVDRPVTLAGVGWPVLDGDGGGTVLHVTADDVTVRGLVVRGTGVSHVREHAAIHFDGVTGCVAEGNRLEDNFFGIHVTRGANCVVRGNTISASGERETQSGNGVHLWNVTDPVVENNDVRGHRDGIYLEHVRGAVIRGNRSHANLRYGLHFMFSSGAAYERNEFRSNGAGVAVMYSGDVRMIGNTFADNRGTAAYGLLLKEITDSEVSGNTFVGNTVALLSDGSARVTVTRNRFTRNGWAARVLANSRQNAFADNDFIDNTFDVTTNSRQSFNTFEGNYWSRYQGYDLTGDGRGDVPHRPVRLFALIVERNPAALMLLRGLFVDLLDAAERLMPALTPETLVDARPRMKEIGA